MSPEDKLKEDVEMNSKQSSGSTSDDDQMTTVFDMSVLAHKTNTFVQRVSVVGMVYALDSQSSKGRRLIWLTWLLFGLGLAVFQIQDRISTYIRYPSNTKFEMISVDSLLFPQITICKEHWMMKSKAEQLGVDLLVANATRILKSLAKLKETEWAKWKEQYFDDKTDAYDVNNWQMLIKNLSFPWRSLVKKAIWNGNISRDIIEEVATDLGYCFAVSTATKPLVSSEPGLRSGLELYLDARQSDSLYLVGHDHDIFAGFRILIHDAKEVPRMYDSGFVVSPGSIAQITISFQNVTLLGMPYNNCSEDPNYRVTNCLAACENQFFFDECRCRPFYFDTLNETILDLPVCSYIGHLRCLDIYKYQRKLTNRKCDCPQPCFSHIYRYATAQSEMLKLASDYYDKLKPSSSPNGTTVPATPPPAVDGDPVTASDYTAVFIHYPNLLFTNVTAIEAYTFFSMLSDVGGALSLLLGATLLTVYETIEFLFLVVVNYLRFRFAK